MNTSKNTLMYMSSLFLLVLTVVAIIGAWALFSASRGYNEYNKTITVSGNGEVFAEPDIAEFTFTIREEEKSVDMAQKAVTKKTNAVLSALRNLGIDEKDVKTQNYNSNPKYEWKRKAIEGCINIDGKCPTESERVLIGYELSQTVLVRVRDIDSAGRVLEILGQNNVENINGPHLRVDDIDAAEGLARTDAIEKARAKAEDMAGALGVRIGKVVDFSENSNGGNYPQPMMARSSKMMVADFAMDESFPEPELPVGENRITANVNITYKIK